MAQKKSKNKQKTQKESNNNKWPRKKNTFNTKWPRKKALTTKTAQKKKRTILPIVVGWNFCTTKKCSPDLDFVFFTNVVLTFDLVLKKLLF